MPSRRQPRSLCSFKNVENAKQGKETSINKANQKRNEDIPAARAQADETVKTANAQAEERVNEAKGQVARLNELYVSIRNIRSLRNRECSMKRWKRFFRI